MMFELMRPFNYLIILGTLRKHKIYLIELIYNAAYLSS